jgi:hypothetical protein
MSGQTQLTEFGGILITIRSGKSYIEVTKAIESQLQRFSVPKLMEYVTHGDREGVEAYVDEVSSPTKFSIFWEMEQGSTMRLAGIPYRVQVLPGRQRRRRSGSVPVQRRRRPRSPGACLCLPARRRGNAHRPGPGHRLLQPVSRNAPVRCPPAARYGDGQGLRGRRLDQRRESGPERRRRGRRGSCSPHGPLIHDSASPGPAPGARARR